MRQPTRKPPTMTINYTTVNGVEIKFSAEHDTPYDTPYVALTLRSNQYCRVDHMLERVFRDYATNKVETIEHTDLPTSDQINHWSRHLIIPQTTCHICLAEAGRERRQAAVAEQAQRGLYRTPTGGTVQVRHIDAKKIRGRTTAQRRQMDTITISESAEELGF